MQLTFSLTDRGRKDDGDDIWMCVVLDTIYTVQYSDVCCFGYNTAVHESPQLLYKSKLYKLYMYNLR